MDVTAYELKLHCGEMIDRAAAGEENVITKRGQVKARMVPADHFDARSQAQMLANMKALREHLARRGKSFTRQEIKAAIAEGRR
jgi:prevent-host-death family protein